MVTVEEELRREKTIVVETKRALDESRRNTDEANKALSVSEEAKKNLEARVDISEAHAKLSKETLAKMEAKVEQRITAGKDELIDFSMYSFWVKTKTRIYHL